MFNFDIKETYAAGFSTKQCKASNARFTKVPLKIILNFANFKIFFDKPRY